MLSQLSYRPAGVNFKVNLTDDPTERVEVQVDVYSGYYVGETDEGLIGTFVIEDNVELVDDVDVINNSIQMFVDLHDWGLLTLRISAPGYVAQTRTIVVDDPTDVITIENFDLKPE